jgi:hypothetical protein
MADLSELVIVITQYLLDEGNSSKLGRQHHELRSRLPNLNVLAEYRGADHHHVQEICNVFQPA